ncbi:hypothetical protein B0T26DRAFT_676834 [Lasiosphaeria miniovina]|uniref:Uncharacterized protein n=1 Tax=Lasiosphaeria miniovina TaxID=1954250 RepID=A0AA40AAL1_9PEZI|nr:uncharacterized protein B0T26DRAFT_676834 [Lasiosphaeria miniovina]KAK0712362.1 hypothetical protein B0T26DRAFT_676834 [Lasiosphaeria miniovina]
MFLLYALRPALPRADTPALGALAAPATVPGPSLLGPRVIVGFLRERLDVVEKCLVYYRGHLDVLFFTNANADAAAVLDSINRAPEPLLRPLLRQLCALASAGIVFSQCTATTPSTATTLRTALRLCCLLAASNRGLGLSRILGLFGDRRPATALAAEWGEMKRVWRCLVAIRVWLRSTLGWAFVDLGPADVLASGQDEDLQRLNGGEYFRREMARMAILKQKMSRKTSPDRLKLYCLHISHQGAVLRLFRRLVRRFGDAETPTAVPKELTACLSDGLLSARHSSRFCLLLETERGSKLLLETADAEWYDDHVLITHMIESLATFCTEADVIAQSFCRAAAERGLAGADAAPNLPVSEAPRGGGGGGDRQYLLTSASGTSRHHVAARELLDFVRRPLGDPRVRPESVDHLFRHSLINHEECSLGLHYDWPTEFMLDAKAPDLSAGAQAADTSPELEPLLGMSGILGLR